MLQECFIQDMLDCFHTCITLLKQKNIKEVRNQSTLQYLIHSPSLRIILQTWCMKYSVWVTSQFFAEMFSFIQSINNLGRQEDPNLTCVCFKSIG